MCFGLRPLRTQCVARSARHATVHMDCTIISQIMQRTFSFRVPSDDNPDEAVEFIFRTAGNKHNCRYMRSKLRRCAGLVHSLRSFHGCLPCARAWFDTIHVPKGQLLFNECLRKATSSTTPILEYTAYRYPFLLRYVDPKGSTCLHEALGVLGTHPSQIDLVRVLLQYGADGAVRDRDGHAPLNRPDVHQETAADVRRLFLNLCTPALLVTRIHPVLFPSILMYLL